MESSANKIGAIVVLFNPDFPLLSGSLKRIDGQVDRIVLVDNSSVNHAAQIQSIAINTAMDYLPLMSNKGIAAAINAGIEHLIELNFDYVLLCDQDSELSEGAVQFLYQSFTSLENNGYAVAVVGTRPINRSTGEPYPPKSKEFGHIPQGAVGNESAITECYSVISSVSLISTKTLLQIGGMDESLFIDGVDHEWCWRAWHKCQLKSFIAEKAIIFHEFGKTGKSITHQNISISSSERLYFQYRNFLWLCKRPNTPKFWKRKNALKYLVKSFYYPLFIAPRARNATNIIKGIYHGLLISNEKEQWPIFQRKSVL